MTTGTQLVADIAFVKHIAGDGQTVGCDKSSLAVGDPRGGGGGASEKFRRGVCPGVLVCRANDDRPRSGGSDQHVLVKGEIVVIGIFFVILAEPIGEVFGDVADLLAHLAAGNRRAAASRVIGDHVLKTVVQHARHQGGLTQTGVPDNGGASGIQALQRHGVIHQAHICPRPHGDLTGGIGGAMLGIGGNCPCQTVGKISVIRGHILVIHRKQGKAAVDDLLGGAVFVGNLRLKIAMNEKRKLFSLAREYCCEWEGKRLAAYHARGDDGFDLCFTRAKILGTGIIDPFLKV